MAPGTARSADADANANANANATGRHFPASYKAWGRRSHGVRGRIVR